MMDFYFPDSQDQIDPRFDFANEQHRPFHVRQRDDLYAHEALDNVRCDGMLVSKPIVDGLGGRTGKYTMAQRHRMYRVGVRRFLRLRPGMKSLGDCGAFSYVADDVPPIQPQDAIDFYDGCGFDEGISVDHVILGYQSDDQLRLLEDREDAWSDRQQITLTYADEFKRLAVRQRCSFTPVGVAQGWSPSSYATSVDALQRMGYRRIALGGMVQLKTAQILEVLRAIDDVRRPNVSLHLLGITRTERLYEFRRLGVTSFDSTSPFLQAFMDEADNYYWHDQHYTAIRVPQVGGNTSLKRSIRLGKVDQSTAQFLEQACMSALRDIDDGRSEDVDHALRLLADYAELTGKPDRTAEYRSTLAAQPWRRCTCGICAKAGIEIAIFRGTERNKRRGFHNLAVFAGQLRHRIEVGHEGR